MNTYTHPHTHINDKTIQTNSDSKYNLCCLSNFDKTTDINYQQQKKAQQQCNDYNLELVLLYDYKH